MKKQELDEQTKKEIIALRTMLKKNAPIIYQLFALRKKREKVDEEYY